jgi:hypothetical protein
MIFHDRSPHVGLTQFPMPAFGRRGTANLTVIGRIGKSRQYRLLYGRSCRARFSERIGTPLYRAVPPQVVWTVRLE